VSLAVHFSLANQKACRYGPLFAERIFIYNIRIAIMADPTSHDQLIAEFGDLTGASPSDVSLKLFFQL
jgi:hypothetical protein